jgi:hypothetical protein
MGCFGWLVGWLAGWFAVNVSVTGLVVSQHTNECVHLRALLLQY